MMLLCMMMCCVTLFPLGEARGGKGKKRIALILNSEETKPENPIKSYNTSKAYLPSMEQEIVNPRTGKIRRIRSPGRDVVMSSDMVLASGDFPKLATSLPENQKCILDRHNYHRRKANPSASNMVQMEWCDEAAKNAANWASQCVIGHSPPGTRKLKDPIMTCGENIMLTPELVSWTSAIDSWESECLDFTYAKGSNGKVTGHYTQMVSAASYKMGCAAAECPHLPYKFNMVCHYCPAGNKKPVEKPYESGAPCASCPHNCNDGLCTNPCKYEDQFGNCNTQAGNCNINPALNDQCGAMCKCVNGEIK